MQSVQAVKNDGVPRGAIPVVLTRNLAVGNTYTIIIYVQGGKLEGSEISEKGSEEEVESVQAVKKHGVPRGAVPVVLSKRYPEPMAHGPEACEPSHPCGSR